MGIEPTERPVAPTIASAMLPPSRSIDNPRDGHPVRDRAEPAFRRPAGLLSRTIKLSLAVGLVALGTAQYLSRVVATGSRDQREARAAPFDPETTGSIGGAAARTTLDP